MLCAIAIVLAMATAAVPALAAPPPAAAAAASHAGAATAAGPEPAGGASRGAQAPGSADAARGAPFLVLYTIGRGESLVEKFGHAALCVDYRDEPARDRCYNYGTTDFSKPLALTWGFLRGRSEFWVSVSRPGEMMRDYREADRSVWRQRIPLTAAQAREAAQLLEHDALPKNRYYQYNHFYNNCSTRVRDILDKVSGGVLSRGADKPVAATFRDFGRAGFAEQTWILIVSDFALGRAADIHPTEYQSMFLPRILRQEVAKRFGVTPALVYARRGRVFSTDPGHARVWIVLFALLIALPALAAHRWRRLDRLGVWVAATPLALIGLVLWAVAIISSLPEARWNEALLVFVPIDAVLPLLRGGRRRAYARARVLMVALVSVLVAVGIFHQPLWAPMLVALFPLLAIAVG